MQTHSIIIIGGGAAGLMAAISAARAGKAVTICEKMAEPGKKILASGNGRCNLLNDNLDASFYNQSSRSFVSEVFRSFGRPEIQDFFSGIGLYMHSQDGRIFPVTNQSSSVLNALGSELKRLSVKVHTGFEVSEIKDAPQGYSVISKSGNSAEGRSVVLACGGKTYPSLGSDGSGYRLAERLGHSIVEPVPVCVPLVVKDHLCHMLQGQKITAKIRCLTGERLSPHVSGDLLFTKYGLSGTAILDISDDISIALNRNGSPGVTLSCDIVPFLELDELAREISRRVLSGRDLTAGILPEKFGHPLGKMLSAGSPSDKALRLKDMRFVVEGTRGWNEAEFTSGGIDVKEVNSATLGSRIREGIYMAGEMLDVTGRRGGYNLAWAWASGFIAGRNA